MRVTFLSFIIIITVACGGKQEQNNGKVVSLEDYESSTYKIEAGNGSIEGLLGNVTQDEIERVLAENRSAMLRCYENAVEDLEEIEGDLRFEIQVASNGTVDEAYISAGDLGSIETESCMLNIVKKFRFKRVPGGVALLSYPMSLEAPYDHPTPAQWNNSNISSVIDKYRSEIDECIQNQTGVHVTAYVGKGGVVLSSGAAGDTAEAYSNAQCLAQCMKKWSFASPPDDLAKVRLDF